MTPMIEAAGVVRRFGKTTALDGLNLLAQQGSILAVLGPNGAGKTTFVRCIATLIKPDAGTLRLFGHDVAREAHAVRSSIGLAGQFAAVASALATIGDGEAQIDESTRRVMVVVDGGWEHLGRALRPLEERGVTLEDVALRPPRLDEVFLALTDGANPEQATDAKAPAIGSSLVPTDDDLKEEIRHG